MSSDPKLSDPDRAHLFPWRKNPNEWPTCVAPLTGTRGSSLKALREQAGEEFDSDLSEAEASKRIDALRAQTGCGR